MKFFFSSHFLTGSFVLFVLMVIFCGPQAWAVGNGPDAGLNTSVGNLTNILNNNIIPVVLITGCLAGIAFSFMKSSPAPFVIALITTVSFGFAKAWINGTYALCV